LPIRLFQQWENPSHVDLALTIPTSTNDTLAHHMLPTSLLSLDAHFKFKDWVKSIA
jgi:hypothetical protein